MKPDRSKPASRVVDDRGNPLPIVAMDLLADQVGGKEPLRSRLGTTSVLSVMRLWSAFGVVALAMLLVWGVYGLRPNASHLLVMLFLLTFPIFQARTNRLLGEKSALASYLAAHRLCGACGYDLHLTPPDGDCCVVCPECGAAWHKDRFVMADLDPRTTMLETLFFGRCQPPTPNACDDRGVPMLQRWKWLPAWIGDDRLTPIKRRELMAAATSMKRRIWRQAGLAVAAVWTIAVLALLWKASDMSLEIFVLTGTIAAMAYFMIWRGRMEPLMRREVARLGLCRSCGATLPEDATRAFDGCIVCESCHRAWKRAV